MMAFLRRIPVPLACYLSATAYLLISIAIIYFAGDPLVMAYMGLELLSTTAVLINISLLICAFFLIIEAFKAYLVSFRAIPDYYK